MRRILSFSITGLAVGLLITMSAPSAQANTLNELTYFTFNAPVEIPGVGLAPGTYMFKVADSESPQIVQVFSQDGSKLYATLFTVPDQRVTPTDKPAVTFEETRGETPAVIKAWFYPGDMIGHEFVYPNEQAAKIAAATGQPVLTKQSVVTTGKSTAGTAGTTSHH